MQWKDSRRVGDGTSIHVMTRELDDEAVQAASVSALVRSKPRE